VSEGITRRWMMNPFLFVEASDGAIELVVLQRDRKARTDRGVVADAPDLQPYKAVLTEARAWRSAVFAPGKEFDPEERAAAWDALSDAKPDLIPPWPSIITEFLRDFHALDDEPDSPTIAAFAAIWVNARYGVDATG